MRPGECGLCGAFGPWRRAGHADWCPKSSAQIEENDGAPPAVDGAPPAVVSNTPTAVTRTPRSSSAVGVLLADHH